MVDRFNMIDMGGIDLINSRGLVVPGLHSKLVESITPCRYLMIYNLSFAGITIPPTVVEAELEDTDVIINEYIVVDANDEINIPSFEPIMSILSATSNGLYLPESGVEGFSQVDVEVPDPVLVEKTITENGTYDPADDSADGYSNVTVEVEERTGIAHSVSKIVSQNIIAEFETSNIEVGVSGLIIKVHSSTYPCYYSNSSDALYVDRLDSNLNCTIYAIVKSMTTGGNYQGVGSDYDQSSGNAPNIFTASSTWRTSVYGNDTDTGITSTVFHVLTLALNASTKKARYFIDGVKYHGEKSFNNCGRYPSIGGGVSNSQDIVSTSNMLVLYGAFVAEVESDETIIANHQILLSDYASYIGT